MICVTVPIVTSSISNQKKEKGKGKEVVTENNNAEVGESSVVENKLSTKNTKEKTVERSPSPVDDVNEEILKIIMKYKSDQEAPSPIDDVNDEILKIVMKYKSHEETPSPVGDEVNDEILKIVMKYKSKQEKSAQETSSPADVVTDDILNIVKNISPSKLIEFAKRKQEVQELQKALDQVDEETKENPVIILDCEESTLHSIHSESVLTAQSEEEIRRGLIDSFYSKAKVQVNITSGDLVTKQSHSTTSSRDKTPKTKKTICNCDDPECSGFREEGDDHHFKHTNVNLNEIEDEYMRRKMQRRLERKKKILTQSEMFSSLSLGTNETCSSETPEIISCDLPETDDIFPYNLHETDEIFPYNLPETDEMFSSDLPETEETFPAVPETEQNVSLDIRESDFFIPPDQTSVVSEPEEEHMDDLSKYINKCKEEYAKKRKEKLSKNILPLDPDVVLETTTPSPEANLSSGAMKEKDGEVVKEKSSENDTNKEEADENVDKSSKAECRKDEIITDTTPPHIHVEIKKKKINIENSEESSASVQVKKKRRIILPVEEGTESTIECRKTKKNKVSFADEVEKSNTNNKCEKNVPEKKIKVHEKYEKKVEVVKCDVKSDKGIPLHKVKVENKNENKSQNDNPEKKLKVSNSSKCDDSKSEKDVPKKLKVDNCPKNDCDRPGKNNSEKKVKTNNSEKESKKSDKDDIDKKDKISVTRKSSKGDHDKHVKSSSHRKAEVNSSEKQNSMKQEKDCEKKVKSEDSTTLNYFDTHERDKAKSNHIKPTNDTNKNYSEKKIKTNDSKKHNDPSINLTDAGKIVESTKKEKKIYTEKDVSMETKKKRTRKDSETRNAFDIIAISSSEDEQADIGAIDIHVSDEHFFSEDDHDGSSEDDDTCKNREKHTSIKEDIAVNSFPPGEMKKRIALTNEEIHRKPVQPHKSKGLKMSYVSPGLKSTCAVNNHVPSTLTSVLPTTTSSAASSSSSSTSSSSSSSPGANLHSASKKRISHVKPSPRTEKKEVDNRPKLEMDIGGKIPHILRQKYFDKIIDELIPKLATKKEAYEKAIADETDAHKRSTRKPLYMNLCANIVKRIRAMPDYVAPKQQPKADPMSTAQPTTKSIPVDGRQTSKKTKVEQPKVADSRVKSSNVSGYQKVDVKGTTSKACIKPASSVLVDATADKVPPLKRERSNSISLEAMELTEDNFYEHMQQYLLTKEQLWEHKYPKRDVDNPQLTVIRDYVPSSNMLKRLCCRCGKEYFMNKKGKYVTRNECNYHWGKLLRQRGRNANAMVFTCCGADGGGSTCAMCRLHVSNKVGPLLNYVSTECSVNKDSTRKVYALDCEMCYTTQGLELTRLTVVDFDLEQIIDLFIKPSNPIVDYNTRFSGVTREDLQDVTTTITDIHDILLNMLDKDTILLGHSLESDLNALNIIHEKVVDTSIVFPHRMGLPLKRALRNLMVEYIQKVIQSGEGGHDSCEDARSCMELMKYKFKEDQKLRKRLKLNSSTR